jgi:adenylate kinase family enzyme
MLGARDKPAFRPRRILVAGTTGAGKSTLAHRLSERLRLPYVEIDSLYHGPGWTRREQFESDVDSFTCGDRWVIEWQYPTVRQQLADRADTVVWLDHPIPVSLLRVFRRTANRSRSGAVLWNGNVEPPLRSVFTSDESILRWAWKTRRAARSLVPALEASHPQLQIVRLRSQRQVDAWLGALEPLSS